MLKHNLRHYEDDTSGEVLATVSADQSEDPSQSTAWPQLVGRPVESLYKGTVDTPTLVVQLTNLAQTGKKVAADAVFLINTRTLSTPTYGMGSTLDT